MRFPKLAAIGLVCLTVTGCASLGINTVTSRNTLYAVTNAYGVALSVASGYKALPTCAAGVKATPQNLCKDLTILARLKAADEKLVKQISDADLFIKTYPTLDATNVIGAAETALASLQAVLAQTGAK